MVSSWRRLVNFIYLLDFYIGQVAFLTKDGSHVASCGKQYAVSSPVLFEGGVMQKNRDRTFCGDGFRSFFDRSYRLEEGRPGGQLGASRSEFVARSHPGGVRW